jgi:Magnesium chelatase, subunit ChlI
VRQPIEDGNVRIVRAPMSLQFPARFTLTAASAFRREKFHCNAKMSPPNIPQILCSRARMRRLPILKRYAQLERKPTYPAAHARPNVLGVTGMSKAKKNRENP